MHLYLWHHLRQRLTAGFMLVALVLTTSASAEPPPTVLVIGDSLSAAYGMDIEQGWVHLLSEKLSDQSPRATVVNASISGDTTGGGAQRLPSLLEQHEPSVVIIELGGNDGLRAYPIKQMRANLATMTQASLEQGAKVLLLAAEAPPNLGRRYTTLFRESYSQLANDENVIALPFIVESIFLSSDLMQSDRTHPNATAQPLLLDVVWPTLTSLLGSPENE
ncbi:MAG: arylesterase [Luminiphilus sp.]